MNLEEFVAQAFGSGDSNPGEFRLAVPQLMKKLSAHTLSDQRIAPLALVAAGVGSGATSLNIVQTARAVNYHFELEHPPLKTAEDLSATHTGQRFLRALALQSEGLNKVSLIPGKSKTKITWNGEQLRFEEHKSSHSVWTICVETRRSPKPTILRHCSLCPVRITLDRETIQHPLAKKYAHYSKGVSPFLRPKIQTNLATHLTVALTSQVRRPVWVAVVNGISYPFTFDVPCSGIVWCNQIKVDAGYQKLVTDHNWNSLKSQLVRLVESTLQGNS